MSNVSLCASAPVEFQFQSNTIRTVAIDGEVWFCAADVCSVLGYVNSRDAVSKHCKTKGVAKRDTLTEKGNQELTYINEPNLYRLIIRSKKPEAEKFETWVMEEVLPAIRKTGAYVHKAYKHGGSDKLSAEQADAIREALRNACEQLPKERQAAFMLRGWSKLRSHFKVGYRQIPAEEFTEAMSITARHIAGHLPLLPPPSVTIPRKQAEDLAKLSQKVCMLFHPLSEYFCYAIGICRLLRGRSANIGDRVEGYVDLLEGVKK